MWIILSKTFDTYGNKLTGPEIYVMEELPDFLIVLEKYFQLLHDLLVYFRTVDIHPHSALKLSLK